MWTKSLCLLAFLFLSGNTLAETPELHGKLALAYLKGKGVDASYIVFISLFDEEDIESWHEFLPWWLMQLSFSPTKPTLEFIVPKLAAVDIRELRWNRESWAKVNDRDPYMVEPAIGRATAQPIREITYHHDNRIGTATIIKGSFFVRDTMETQRSPSYYDLLYSEQRFVNGKFIDFPKDEKDWNDVHGIALDKEFLKEKRITIDHGAVAAGRFDDPEKGSIVAKSNRALLFVNSKFGVALKSFDTDTTSGETDFVERAPEISQGKIKSKANEYLVTLPGGGQAAFLTDGAGKRLELGGSQFVENTIDKRYKDVRVPVSCVMCHGPELGIVAPRNLIDEIKKAGIETKILLKDAHGNVLLDHYGKPIRDREKEIRHSQFFLNWDRKIKGWRIPAENLLGSKPASWYAAKLIDIRDRYDQPLKIEQAAKECGVPLDQFKVAIDYSPGVRLRELLHGRSIPREVWEKEIYLQAIRLLAVDLSKPLVKKGYP